MKIETHTIAGLAREAGWRTVNAVLLIVGLALLVALEAWSAWYAMASAPQTDLWSTPWGAVPRAALLHGLVGGGFGLAAFLAMYVAGSLAQDERAQVRASAIGARIVALGMLLVPIGNLAGAINMDHRLAEWDAYTSSPAYAADQALALDAMADSMAKAAASARLIPPTAAEFDPIAYAQAVFFHLMVALMASIRMAAPITQAEREALAAATAAAALHQKRKAAAAKAAATRKANAKAKKGALLPFRQRA